MVEHSFGIDVPLEFEHPYVWEDFFYFQNLFSWDYSPVLSFYVRVDFLDNDLLKISRVRCIHGLIVVENICAVTCGEHYGIQYTLFYPQVVFVNDVIVVVALFI